MERGSPLLLNILAGTLEPDDGLIVRSPSLRVALLPQQVPRGLEGTVESLIASQVQDDSDAGQTVQRLCSLLHLTRDQPFSSLSGGQKRRALLGVRWPPSPTSSYWTSPPTIWTWTESSGSRASFPVSGRASSSSPTIGRFSSGLAGRIIELDRGRLTSWDCDYPTYLARKEALLANEEKEWALFDKNLAKEEEWIRQGIKARRTRNEGRVRALKELRAQRAQRRERVGQVRMTIQESERSGARVVETKGSGVRLRRRIGHREGICPR